MPKRYVQYLSLLRDLESSAGLDSMAERVLVALLRAHYAGRVLQVVHLAQRVPGLSSTTVLRRLRWLAAHGFVALTGSAQDARIKFVTPTARAEELFAQRGRALEQATRLP